MATIVNPFASWPISQGWTQGSHKNNPAIDYPMAVGTPLYAPAAGRVSLQHWNGSRSGGNPGNKVVIILPNGYSIHLAHLSRFNVTAGQQVGQMQLVGWSGNTGDVRPAPTSANPNSGAHLHTFGLTPSGARWNWILDAGGSPAGSEDEDMPLTNNDLIAILNAKFSTGRKNSDGTPEVVSIAQALSATYFYGDRFEKRIPGQPARQNQRALDDGDGTALRLLLEKIDQKPVITDAQVKEIAAAILRELGNPTVTIDYEKIANDVREKFKNDPLK